MNGPSTTLTCPSCGYSRLSEEDPVCPQCHRPLPSLRRLDPARNKIIAYRNLLERVRRGFASRVWLDQLVTDFLAQTNGPPHLLLLGEPGCGKTSYLAHLAHTYGYPHHFIGRGTLIDLPETPDWRSPVRMAESIGYQLVRDFGGWIMDWENWGIHVSQSIRELEGVTVGALSGQYVIGASTLSVEQEIERYGQGALAIGVYVQEMHLDPELVIRQLLTRPLQAIAARYPDRQLVILLDGLDEADDYSNPRHNILHLLPLAELPESVRFIFASRPGDHLDRPFRESCLSVWLSADPQGTLREEIRSDALSFATMLAADEQIAAQLLAHRRQPARFAAALATASQGNFLYLYYLAQNLRSEPIDEALFSLEALPVGLHGIYNHLLLRMRRRVNDIAFWARVMKPVLGVLSVARAPLDRMQISAFADVDPDSLAAVLMYLQPFLDTNRATDTPLYTLYHKSFGDHIVSPENEDGIDAIRVHRRIVHHYRRATATPGADGWDALDSYGQEHLPRHAAWADELTSLLEEPGFLTHCSPRAIREAIEITRNLTGQQESITEVLLLAYPHLLQIPPLQRAAVVHLFALRQGAESVAGLFTPVLKDAPFRTLWTATALADVPYRQRTTLSRVETLATGTVGGEFTVVYSENVRDGGQQMTVWQPVADTVRANTLKGRAGFERSAVVRAGERDFLVLREISLGGDAVLIVDLDELEIVQTSWNQSVTVFANGAELVVAEADFAGALYIRPLYSPPMYRHEGSLQTGLSLRRNEVTRNERPTLVLPSGIRQIVPLTEGRPARRLLLIDRANALYLHDPLGDASTTLLGVDVGAGRLVIRSAIMLNEPVVAILSHYQVLIIDPRDGRSLGRLEASQVRAHSDATHWNDIALLESRTGAFLLLETSEWEVLFFDLSKGKIVRTVVMDQLEQIAAGSDHQDGFLITGHESAVKVWAPENLLIGQRVETGHTPLVAAAMVDDVPFGIVLTGFPQEKERQIRVYDLRSGELQYEHTVKRWTFRPHLLALCRGSAGPFVVFQPDWNRDELEVHSLSRDGIRTTWHISDGRPDWMDDELFRLLDIQLTFINPSRACQWFIHEALRDRIDSAAFWEGHVSRCAIDRHGDVLAGCLYRDHRRASLHILASGARPRTVALQNIHPTLADVVAVTRYRAQTIVATFGVQNGALIVWIVADTGLAGEDDVLLHLSLDSSAPIVAFGLIADQLVIALGLRTEVAVFPLTPGPLREPVRIPGQVTSCVWGPEGLLLLALPDGILTVHVGPPD